MRVAFTGSAAPRQKNNRLPSINSQQKNPKAKVCNKFSRHKHQHVNFQLKVNASMFFFAYFFIAQMHYLSAYKYYGLYITVQLYNTKIKSYIHCNETE
jgi:hypothetical protein